MTTITSIPSSNSINSTTSTTRIATTTITCSLSAYGNVPSLYNSFSEKLSSLSTIVIIYNTQYGVYGLQFNYKNSISSTFGVSQSALSQSGYSSITYTISLADVSYIGSVTTCSNTYIYSLKFTLCTNSNNCTTLSTYGSSGGICTTINGIRRYLDISTQQMALLSIILT